MNQPPVSLPNGVDPRVVAEEQRKAQIEDAQRRAADEQRRVEAEARKAKWIDSITPPPARDVIEEAPAFEDSDDGIDRAEIAAEYLARLESHREILESYGKAGVAIYTVARHLLRTNRYSEARRRGYSDSELFGIIVGGSPTARRIEPVGILTRLPAGAEIKKFEAARVLYETTDRHGSARHGQLDRPRARSYRETIMPWDAPPRAPHRTPNGVEGDRVSSWDSVTSERDALLSLLNGQASRSVGQTCASCAHCAMSPSGGDLGFCQRNPPSPENAARLAERLGVPISAMSINAAWPVVSLGSGCGKWRDADPPMDLID